MRQGLMEAGLVMGLTRDDREGLAFALAAWQVTDVALGDVHGDGSEELAVIEEKADGPAQAVSVWRWTGWTISLAWSSPYGRYGDLILVEGNQAVISAALTRSK